MPDNKHIVSSGEDNKVYIWDLENGGYKLMGTTKSLVLSLSVSPDGSLIAAGTKDGKTILWETNSYVETILHDEPNDAVQAVAFSHSGKMLATGDLQGNLKYWNVARKSMIANVHGHSARITDLKFSPNDELLASSSFDATVQLWLTNDYATPPVKLQGRNSWVLSIAFSPAGDKIISGCSKGGSLLVDPTLARAMAGMFCSKLNRNMTQNEWDAYVGKDIPYEKTCGN
jgi:WD40 repeat protein